MRASTLGTKIRALRRRENLTQSELAARLGISPSYLNLIENNRRPLPAQLLLQLAQLFALDITALAGEDETRLLSELLEAFGDPLFSGFGLTNTDLRELTMVQPNVGRAVLALYQGYVAARGSASDLASRMAGAGEGLGVELSRLPSEEVSALIERHGNHFPELERAAEEVFAAARLDSEGAFAGLSRYLLAQHGVEVRLVRVADERKAMRRFDPERRVLLLSEVLPPRSRRFQLAHQIGLLTQAGELDRLSRDETLTTPESRALARVALSNYFAAALLMPYGAFFDAARAERYDIELLAHRFGASFEQVCHRLTTLRRKGQEGIPFHLLRIDIAGNISKRFGGSGFRFARFSGACPRLSVFQSFLTPGMFRVQLSRTQAADGGGGVYFSVARTLRHDRGGYHMLHPVQAIELGCELRYARQIIYSDGVDLENPDSAVPVGVTCRLCDQMDCEQRAFPSLRHPMRIDENLRGVSFYAPVPPAGLPRVPLHRPSADSPPGHDREPIRGARRTPRKSRG